MVQHLRLRWSGCYGVDPNAVARIAECRALYEPGHPPLAGAVVTVPGVPDESARRRRVDNRAASLVVLHLLQLVFQAKKGAAQICPDHPIELLDVDLVHWDVGSANTGIVECAVEAPEGLDGELDGASDRIGVLDVALDGDRLGPPASDLLDQRLEPIEAPRRGHHLGSLCGEPLDRREPDTARSAGHEDHPISKSAARAGANSRT